MVSLPRVNRLTPTSEQRVQRNEKSLRTAVIQGAGSFRYIFITSSADGKLPGTTHYV